MKLMLQQERIQRQWSQKYVGKHIGITAEAVGMMETGKRRPSYDVLVKLENLFGMTHRELFAAAPAEEAEEPQCLCGSSDNPQR